MAYKPTIDDILSDAEQAIEQYTSDESICKRVTMSECGLDQRQSYKLWVSKDCVIVPLDNDGNLRYYGGFEYIDKEYRNEISSYVVYRDDDNRVTAVCSKIWGQQNNNDEDEEQAQRT